ncbi:hypothetical protein M433DRAFT_23193 [Acidomyces richmondensis BFW]|nr:MAG: hypothetical protein FE78DRAFT_38256 [Acidomyces sp. 'richmondensis']KYG47145.1 hypothetical protein M433DRAFT_23193 [Acidomyces richmondensis BFW]
MEDRTRVEAAARDESHDSARHSEEELPSYSEATEKFQSSIEVTEKEFVDMQSRSKKTWSLPAIKRALKRKDSGELVGATATSSTVKPSSSMSTLKSILTGDIYKYHPLLRYEHYIDAEMRRERR